jgi:hypothetical protein
VLRRFSVTTDWLVPRGVPLICTVSVLPLQFQVLPVSSALEGPTVATTLPLGPSTLLPVIVVTALPSGPRTAVV